MARSKTWAFLSPSASRMTRVVRGASLMGLAVMTVGMSLSALADELSSEQVAIPQISYLEVARDAIAAGDMDKAANFLAQARTCWRRRQAECGFSRLEYQAIVGLVYLEYGQNEQATKALSEVVAKQPEREAIWLYLGEAHFRLKQYGQAVEALAKAPVLGGKSPAYFVMMAVAQARAGDTEGSIITLSHGLTVFVDDPGLLREAVKTYLEYSMTMAAGELARRLAIAHIDPSGYWMIADHVRQNGAPGQTQTWLEEALITAGPQKGTLERMAYGFAGTNRPALAAATYGRMAATDPDMAFLAGEQYRLAGDWSHAIEMNAFVDDERRRLTQQLAVYIGRESYSLATQMHSRLSQAGLLNDHTIVQLGYAAIRSGRFDTAIDWLTPVCNGTQALTARRLLSAAVNCKEIPWLCP